MNNLSKELMCIQIRSGVEIWLERERAENFIKALSMPNAPQFVEVDGNMINRADVVGIFGAANMEDSTRRKNRQWQCKIGTWHEKNQECSCDLTRARSDDEEKFFRDNGYYKIGS